MASASLASVVKPGHAPALGVGAPAAAPRKSSLEARPLQAIDAERGKPHWDYHKGNRFFGLQHNHRKAPDLAQDNGMRDNTNRGKTLLRDSQCCDLTAVQGDAEEAVAAMGAVVKYLQYEYAMRRNIV